MQPEQTDQEVDAADVARQAYAGQAATELDDEAKGEEQQQDGAYALERREIGRPGVMHKIEQPVEAGLVVQRVVPIG